MLAKRSVVVEECETYADRRVAPEWHSRGSLKEVLEREAR